MLQRIIEKCREIGNKDGKYYHISLGKYYHISLDMMNKKAPKELVKYAENMLGGIDYVVLNHVVQYHFDEWLGSSDNLTTLERTFTINFNSYVSIASHAMPRLELSRGSIIVMSSIGGRMPVPLLATYIATKHALQVRWLMYIRI